MGGSERKGNQAPVSNFQYYRLVAFVIITELSYGVCQEVLYGMYKFPYAWFSTFLQCIFYSVVSTTQYVIATGTFPSCRKKGFPIFSHLMIGGSSLVSRATGNAAFKYMDYSLKVLFTSANPIVVLITGVFYKKTYSLVQYLSTIMLALGLIIFSYADSKAPGGDFSIIGVILMITSVSTDALKMRTQEEVLKQQKITEVEATMWSSFIGMFFSFILVIFSGELIPAYTFILNEPKALMWMLLIFAFGYTASIATLSLMLASDVFVASIISTTRKALTVFISFLTFGKQVTIQHGIAIGLFFCGIIWNSSSKRSTTKIKKEL